MSFVIENDQHTATTTTQCDVVAEGDKVTSQIWLWLRMPISLHLFMPIELLTVVSRRLAKISLTKLCRYSFRQSLMIKARALTCHPQLCPRFLSMVESKDAIHE